MSEVSDENFVVVALRSSVGKMWRRGLSSSHAKSTKRGYTAGPWRPNWRQWKVSGAALKLGEKVNPYGVRNLETKENEGLKITKCNVNWALKNQLYSQPSYYNADSIYYYYQYIMFYIYSIVTKYIL